MAATVRTKRKFRVTVTGEGWVREYVRSAYSGQQAKFIVAKMEEKR